MTPARKPKGRTLAEFEPLRPAEEKLRSACWQGEVAHIAESRPEAAHENNTVRAAFLRFLALGGDGQTPVHERGVRLQGAWITGTLDLISTSVPSGLSMVHCQFNETPLFTGTNIAGTLDFTGSQLPGFVGRGVTVSGNLTCIDAIFDGKVVLAGAQINGSLGCNGAIFEGKVNLLDVQIDGFLDCTGAEFDSKDDEDHTALVAGTAVINGNVFLTQARAIGAVFLVSSQIDGFLDCTGAEFDGNNDSTLVATGTVIKGDVVLDQVRATGTVFLDSVRVDSNLKCTGAIFKSNNDYALVMDGAVIKKSVLLDQVHTTGEVRLLGAKIDGFLKCTDAALDGNGCFSLQASDAIIKGSVDLNHVHATGAVYLECAQIDGNLYCTGATLDGKKSKDMAAAEAILIKEMCRLGYGVIVDEKKALIADGMTVTKTFIFQNTSSSGSISLAGAHIGRLEDDANSWANCIILDGLTYGGITGDAPTDATTRLAWLDKQSPKHTGRNINGIGFRPQPWKQLAKVLREMGHAEDARQVSIAFEKRLREAGRIGQAPASWGTLSAWIYEKTCRAGHYLFGLLTGYGYRPLRLLTWMVIVWLACAGFFWYTALGGVFGPSSPLVFQHPAYADCQPPGGNWYICGKLPEEYSGFSPLAYSLDVILPFVDLQQANSWAPLIPTSEAVWYKEILALFDWKHATRLLMWFETLFGWVSSLLMVAVLSGLAKRREE